MAFCNSCGAQVDDAAAFCRSCGKPLPRTATAPPQAGFSPQPPPPTNREVPFDAPRSGSSVVKVVLIVFAVIIGMGVLGVVSAFHMLKRVKVEQRGDRTHVETPFGTVDTNADPAEVAKNLGVEVYPGAKALESSSAVTVGSMKTATATFTTSDPPDKVSEFYEKRLPNARVSTHDGKEHTIVADTESGMTTVSIDSSGGKTTIVISTIAGKHMKVLRVPQGKEPPEPPEPPPPPGEKKPL